MKHITVYHSQTKILLKPVQSYSPYYSEDFMIEFNGQEIPVVKSLSWAFESGDEFSAYSLTGGKCNCLIWRNYLCFRSISVQLAVHLFGTPQPPDPCNIQWQNGICGREEPHG